MAGQGRQSSFLLRCDAAHLDEGINRRAQRVVEVYEIGAGKALSGMIRRIDRSLECTTVNDVDGVKAAAEKMG